MGNIYQGLAAPMLKSVGGKSSIASRVLWSEVLQDNDASAMKVIHVHIYTSRTLPSPFRFPTSSPLLFPRSLFDDLLRYFLDISSHPPTPQYNALLP